MFDINFRTKILIYNGSGKGLTGRKNNNNELGAGFSIHGLKSSENPSPTRLNALKYKVFSAFGQIKKAKESQFLRHQVIFIHLFPLIRILILKRYIISV